MQPPPRSTLFPYTTLFRSLIGLISICLVNFSAICRAAYAQGEPEVVDGDRKSTRLNSSHANISYAVFCLKKKKILLQTCAERKYLLHVFVVMPDNFPLLLT